MKTSGVLVENLDSSPANLHLNIRQNGQQQPATFFTAWLQNELNSDVARFISHESNCIATNQGVVCYTAVFSVVTQRSVEGALRDDSKNGCVAD